MIQREKNANVWWTSTSDADDTLEERRYYCQNWRADVVALLESDGDVSEWVRYCKVLFVSCFLAGWLWGCGAHDRAAGLPIGVVQESPARVAPTLLVVRLAVFEAFPEISQRWFSGPRTAMVGIAVELSAEHSDEDIASALCSSTTHWTFRSHRELADILVRHPNRTFAEGTIVNRNWRFRRCDYAPGEDWDPELARNIATTEGAVPSVHELPVGDPLVGFAKTGTAVICELPAICTDDRLTIAWCRGHGRATRWGEPPDQFASLLWKHADANKTVGRETWLPGWTEIELP